MGKGAPDSDHLVSALCIFKSVANMSISGLYAPLIRLLNARLQPGIVPPPGTPCAAARQNLGRLASIEPFIFGKTQASKNSWALQVVVSKRRGGSTIFVDRIYFKNELLY